MLLQLCKNTLRNIVKADIGVNLQRLCNDAVQHCNLALHHCRDVAAMSGCCVGRGGKRGSCPFAFEKESLIFQNRFLLSFY